MTVSVIRATLIDDLRKSRGLHSVSAYRHGLYIQVQAEHVGKMTDTRI